MRFLRVVAVVVAAMGAGWILLPASPAGADCVGPTIEVSVTEVARGETVNVSGRFFGTDCYDTGPPPQGQGTLGRPGTDIEVVFVQDDAEIVVAEGNADSDYSFDVTVVVPPQLAPGAVTIAARYPPHFQTYDDPTLQVSDAAPIAGAEAAVARFGVAGLGRDDRTDVEGSAGFPTSAVVVGLGLGLAVVAAAAIARTRSKTTS